MLRRLVGARPWPSRRWWRGYVDGEPRISWRDAHRLVHAERRDRRGPGPHDGLSYVRLCRYVASFGGWPLTIGLAVVGPVAALLALAVFIATAVLAARALNTEAPEILPVATWSLLTLGAGYLLEEALRRRVWRSALSVGAFKLTTRPPGTFGLTYEYAGASASRACEALATEGFACVRDRGVAHTDETPAPLVVEIVVVPQNRIDQAEAEVRAARAFASIGAEARMVGSSHS